jgi:uncharacterized protein YlxP (DUF503 family)
MTPAVCVIEIDLHFGEVRDLKGKRKLVKSLKDHLHKRFGAAVAETGAQDKWQRATLLCALVGDGTLDARVDELQRFVESRHPEGCSFRREIRTLNDLRG